MAYPTSILRTLALHTQNLTAPLARKQDTSPVGIINLIEQMGCVQLDTLQMIARTQYIALWSRLGNYNRQDFDEVAYGSESPENDRHLFEYWFHAACLIPIKQYRYHLPIMHKRATQPGNYYEKWLSDGQNQEMLTHVQQRIQAEGALRTSDFEKNRKGGESWWGWKPSKRALEHLYNSGELMIANRIKFQRVYDLKERVLPNWVDTTMPTWDEYYRFFLELGVKMMGVCQPNQASDAYHDIKRTPARLYIEALMKEGIFVEIEGLMADGNTATFIVHRDNLPLLEQIADGAITAQRTTFMSPFDNIFWVQKRDQQLWGFDQTIEMYKRPPERVWGYFCLPILYKDRLIGRFDVKLERKTKILRWKALHLEPNITIHDEMISGIVAALRDFMAFHHAETFIIEQSNPLEFSQQIMKLMQV